MSQTIQETITTPATDYDQPYRAALNRMKDLGLVIKSNSTTSSYNGDSPTKKSVTGGLYVDSPWKTYLSKTTTIYLYTGGYLSSDNTIIKLTYNIDKKLCAITGYTDNSTAINAVYTRILLLASDSDIWHLTRQNEAGSDIQFNSITPSAFPWWSALGQNSGDARPSPDGKIALQSNPLLGFSSSDTWGQSQHRLNGNGIYVAKEDIAGPWDDVGRIIADETGKAYICCGNRIWMDYDSE